MLASALTPNGSAAMKFLDVLARLGILRVSAAPANGEPDGEGARETHADKPAAATPAADPGQAPAEPPRRAGGAERT